MYDPNTKFTNHGTVIVQQTLPDQNRIDAQNEALRLMGSAAQTLGMHITQLDDMQNLISTILGGTSSPLPKDAISYINEAIILLKLAAGNLIAAEREIKLLSTTTLQSVEMSYAQWGNTL